jgi:hypothetical protein
MRLNIIATSLFLKKVPDSMLKNRTKSYIRINPFLSKSILEEFKPYFYKEDLSNFL